MIWGLLKLLACNAEDNWGHLEYWQREVPSQRRKEDWQRAAHWWSLAFLPLHINMRSEISVQNHRAPRSPPAYRLLDLTFTVQYSLPRDAVREAHEWSQHKFDSFDDFSLLLKNSGYFRTDRQSNSTLPWEKTRVYWSYSVCDFQVKRFSNVMLPNCRTVRTRKYVQVWLVAMWCFILFLSQYNFIMSCKNSNERLPFLPVLTSY